MQPSPIHSKGIGMTGFTAFRWQILLLIVLIGSTTPALCEDDSNATPSLTIGSAAPPLIIENWVQDGNGAFEPVTTFSKSHVYVVEFWATWCGPCVASMPHLAELQGEYSDKQVQIISITTEDLKTVEAFLDRNVRGDDEKTYRELTAAYCLTSDPDRSCYADYMEAAQQQGIPTAFIVGKDGHIEWIGHPNRLDEPLGSIVDSTWDRDLFAAEFEFTKPIEQAFNDGMRGSTADAIESLKKLADTTDLDSVEDQIQQAIGFLQKKLVMDSLKDNLRSSEPDFTKLERQLVAATSKELPWVVSQIGQLVTKEREAITKYDEVVSTMLDILEKRFGGEDGDELISQIYANVATLIESPEQAASRIEGFLKTYNGPASPLLKHVADSFRKSAEGGSESSETQKP